MGLISEIRALFPKIVASLKDSVSDFSIVEDLFVTSENLAVALTGNFLIHNDRKPQQPLTYIQQNNAELQKILVEIATRHTSRSSRFTHHKMESCGFALLRVVPSKVKNEEYLVVGHTDHGNGHGSSVTFRLSKDLLLDLNGPDAEFTLQGTISSINPYEVLSTERHYVVSDVATLSVLNAKQTPLEDLKITKTSLPFKVIFPLPEYELNLNELDCAVWAEEYGAYDKSRCETGIYGGDHITCSCSRMGTFALVIEKHADSPPLRRKDQKRRPPYIPPANFEPHFTHILFGFALIAVLWVLTLIVRRSEDFANELFNNAMTVHPVYSILYVRKASMPRTVRLHLYFLTLSFEFFMSSRASRTLHEDFIDGLVITLLTTWVFNYIWGFIARILAGGQGKVRGRKIALGLLTLLSITFLVLANLNTAYANDVPGARIFEFWIAAVVLDLLVFDPLGVFFSRVSLIQSILRFRGFYSEFDPTLASVFGRR
eukprot:TRINITY_DN11975_c0_g1_i1.p1 TRINITY_DN11975_c0_g1~~TRINITY_DN11975_c0_g1_i1.p1  ORF type:complete len:487 (+),score=109.37 TRINITY_DN11975_c0_g1_i1:124-1584(+)